ncbi:MAG: sensor histidine kinase [Desulfopila sp.]
MKIVKYDNSPIDSPTARLDSSQEIPRNLQAEKNNRMMEDLQPDLPNPMTVRRVVYDLRVHQIEVEIQNEGLRSLQQELEASKTRFKDLCDFAPTGSIKITDINDGIRLAEEKKRLESKCRSLEKAESLGRMAGAIAHHFNNMLGAVMGNQELTQYGIAQETESSNNLTTAMHGAQRAAEISSSMLTYLGQSSAQQEQLDFAATFRTCLAGRQVVVPKEVELVVDVPADGPTVDTNVYQVHQVLKNLMTNAWESQNQRRGAIHLSMKTLRIEDIPAIHRFPRDFQFQHNLYTCLTVQDAGCGIAEPDIENLFDPFYTSKFFGRGLGLPIVLGIVRAHSGFFMVTSKVDRGSLFSIFLPVSGRGFIPAGDRVIEAQEIT